MEEILKKIREEWNANVEVPMSEKPTLIHHDEGMLMFKLMYEELLEFRDAINEKDIVEVSDALGDIAYLLFGTVNQYGLHEVFEKVLYEIHRSNQTKLVGGQLMRREDGKILKPDTYEKPELAKIIEK